jgi:hypothetical protein|tara:strand:- start:7947 stop:8198 length:252 start_codon:yes stop_codon:yes gene_type:complete
MGHFKDKQITREEDMTYYIEKCTKEIMSGLELDNLTDERLEDARLIIERVLHRNIDELFKLLLKERDNDNKNIHGKEEEVQAP